MIRHDIKTEYFEWLNRIVCDDDCHRRLITHLHNVEFRYLHPMDQNRAEDGENLRYRFVYYNDYMHACDEILDILAGPCSVLEMIIALAIRCEEDDMDDPRMGNRTRQWFWGMIVNLGLGSMTNEIFDRREVDRILDRFMNREYEPDGRGGLFTIKNCDRDVRDVEIWWQLGWYLNSIT